jgi:hypothetical protein
MYLKFLAIALGFGLSMGALPQAAVASGLGGKTPYAEGLPLPWPFPWARDCSVDWASMEGEYTLVETDSGDQISLRISAINKLNVRVARVARISQSGTIMSEGFTFLTNGQKTIRLWLFSVGEDDPPMWASIVMYYPSNRLQCQVEELVPILTMERFDRVTRTRSQIQYRLVRGRR